MNLNLRGSIRGKDIEYDLEKKESLPNTKVYVSAELLKKLPELKKILVKQKTWLEITKRVLSMITYLSIFILKGKSKKVKDNDMHLLIIEALYILIKKLKAESND